MNSIKDRGGRVGSFASANDIDDFDEEPIEKGYGKFGDFELVGNGEQTNSKCGTFSSFFGCARVELHGRPRIDGKNFKGKVYVRKVFNSCDKASCPICYKKGWAVREAKKIEERLAHASRKYGQVEHIVVSVPQGDYGLTSKALRAKARKILKSRGIIGGVLLFHAFRFNRVKFWYFSPHYHILGFIAGGYSRCRNCVRKWNCLAGCGAFDDKNYGLYLKDGYIVKVMGKRKTVGGTAWYQLNHASRDVTKKNFHIATWFGVCSYRKLKFTRDERKKQCPICQHELVRLNYCGRHAFILDKSHEAFRVETIEDVEEDGRRVWIEEQKPYVVDRRDVFKELW